MSVYYKRFKDENNEMNTYLTNFKFGDSSTFHYSSVLKNGNIFTHPDINVSGSKALQLYNRYILKNNIEFQNGDIDIYFKIRKTNLMVMKDIILKLLVNGYEYKKYKRVITAYAKFDIDLNKALKRTFDTSETLNVEMINKKYFSLATHIAAIFKLKNHLTNKNIDIIIIKGNIKHMLIESFDYNIVKNYYCKGILYILNPTAIINKKATMTSNHFKSRVLFNFHELFNFIIRYTKYTNRGYNIFIDNNQIPECFVYRLHKILIYCFYSPYYYKYFNNNIYECDLILKAKLLDFYYKTFYIHEELVQKVYHPNNILKKSNEYLLDEYE